MFEIYEVSFRNYLPVPQTPGSMLRQSRKKRDFNIRPMEESDTGLLTDFMSRLTTASLWMRYFVPYPSLSKEAADQEIARLNQIRRANGLVLVATIYLEGQEEIIGIGELIPDQELFSTAEIALILRDDYQGEGIGSAMTIQLAQEAAKKGIATLQAEAMTQNRAMLRIWKKLGLPYRFHTQQSITSMVARLGE